VNILEFIPKHFVWNLAILPFLRSVPTRSYSLLQAPDWRTVRCLCKRTSKPLSLSMFIKHWLIDETVSFQNDGYVEFYLLGHNTVHAVR
jgi:hypothetical protein